MATQISDNIDMTLFPAIVLIALWISASIVKVHHFMTSRDTIMDRADLRGIPK